MFAQICSNLEGNYSGVIILGTIIQAPIVRAQFFWGQLSGVNCPRTISLTNISIEHYMEGVIR